MNVWPTNIGTYEQAADVHSLGLQTVVHAVNMGFEQMAYEWKFGMQPIRKLGTPCVCVCVCVCV
jgi:hypothetical protein